MSIVSKLAKKHKLYFRTRGGQLKSLSKTSEDLFVFILNEFLVKGKNAEYLHINKAVEKWNQYKPITLEVPEEYETEYKTIFGFSPTTFSYDGSWKPLATLKLKSKKD